MQRNQFPELTLVLPMYNVEQFVERCLESIYCEQPDVEQERIEVVLVDDGSPDRSAAVAEAWLTAHGARNHRIIHQENRGLGGARNTGLRAARAPYVWFIDTDDRLAPRSLAPLLSRLAAGMEVYSYNFRYVYADGSTYSPYSQPECLDISGCELMETICMVTACFSIYSTEFLRTNSFFFREKFLHEDNEFNLRVMFRAQHCSCYPDVVYCYCMGNPGSIMRNATLKHVTDAMEHVHTYYALLASHPDITSQQLHALQHVTHRVISMMYVESTRLPDSQQPEFRRMIRQNRCKLLRAVSTCRLHTKVFGLLAALFPYKSFLRAMLRC